MKWLFVCVAVVLLVPDAHLVPSLSGRYKKSSVVEAFKKAGIVPDFIPVAPPKLLGAEFENAVVNLGNDIYPADTIDPPTLSFQCEKDALYTFIILDLDEPSREDNFLSPVVVALYVNVINLDLESACEMVQYFAVTPIPGTGPHRYILLLYKQECFIDSSNPDLAAFQNKRAVFPLADFVKNNSLCDPVAGNFFLSQFPDDIESYCDLSY